MSKIEARIAKWIANCGVCSRRQAEQWIYEGRVTYRGEKVLSPAFVLSDPEQVCVDGSPLQLPEAVRIWMFYKPRGMVTTRHDPQSRPTVYEAIPDGLGYLMKVGRLDIESEGLLLFTNNGDTARQLEHPSAALKRTYQVRVFGDFQKEMLDWLREGVVIEDIRYRPILGKVEKSEGKQTWLRLTLTEGKNREIRNVMRYLGMQVSRLIRIAYGDHELGDLKPGEWRESEVRTVPLILQNRRL